MTCLALLPAAATAQTLPDGYSPERLLPEKGQQVQSDINLRGQGTDDEISGSAFLRTPLWQSENSYLMLQGEGSLNNEWDHGETQWGGTLGLIWRQGLDLNDAWGVNAFVDLGAAQGFAGQGSVGLEYEHLGARGTSYRAGSNLYLPFADYTEDYDRGRAPRLGGDFYLGVGQDHGPHRVEGFLTGFHYLETEAAKPLWGVTGQMEYRYAGLDFLPTGSHLYASLGARWDTIEDEISPLFGVGISITFWDDGQHERVAEVRRNLGYGSPFVPIDYKDQQCMAGDVPKEMAVDFSTYLTDGDDDFNEIFPGGTSVPGVLPPGAIDTMCQGYSDCLSAMNSLVLPQAYTEGLTTIHYVKAAGTCGGHIEFVVNSG